MIGIIDYGVGNLFSLRSSLQYIGKQVVVASSEKQLAGCSHLILPGVGAFARCGCQIAPERVGHGGASVRGAVNACVGHLFRHADVV